MNDNEITMKYSNYSPNIDNDYQILVCHKTIFCLYLTRKIIQENRIHMKTCSSVHLIVLVLRVAVKALSLGQYTLWFSKIALYNPNDRY